MTLRRLDIATICARATASLVVGTTVDLTDLYIDAPLDLTGMALANVDFSGTCFEHPLVCRGAVFQGLAWFKGCTFRRGADLSTCVFENDARFDGALFDGPMTFAHTEFRGIGCVDRARFAAPVTFDGALASASLSFDHTAFLDHVSLRRLECLGGLWLQGTHFAKPVALQSVEVHGKAWLSADGAMVASDAIIAYGYIAQRKHVTA